MKKTFPLIDPARDAPRVLEGVKHEVRKYMKRERRKTPPYGFDFWEFACRVGADQATAVIEPIKQVTGAIEVVARAGSPSVYVEILATPAKWPEPPPAEIPPSSSNPDLP